MILNMMMTSVFMSFHKNGAKQALKNLSRINNIIHKLVI